MAIPGGLGGDCAGMERIRCIHVITRLILGGAQENTLYTCAGHLAKGHRVTLVTGPSPGPDGELLQEGCPDGLEVIVMPELVRELSPLTDWRAYRALLRLFRERRGPAHPRLPPPRHPPLARCAGLPRTGSPVPRGKAADRPHPFLEGRHSGPGGGAACWRAFCGSYGAWPGLSRVSVGIGEPAVYRC